jgi:choline dehydrogenase-like flavoprotein
MSIMDANELAPGSLLAADLCVVGAGAAGITLASEFDGMSQKVCLLESGSYRVDEDTQSLYDLSSAGYPITEDFMSRARYFGGTCNLWAGRSMKLTALDLEARDWVPDSGWPMQYGELDRYYDQAGRILGIPSFESFARILERRMSPSERALFDHPDLKPNISLWARTPLRFAARYKATLKRSRNVDVYLHANATEVLLNSQGDTVEELKIATLGGKRMRIRAKRFVLACGGLENARLLLVSSGRHETGVGNQHDLVGRFYMDHPRAVSGTVRLRGTHAWPMILGHALREGIGQVGIQLSEARQRDDRLLNHYLTLERKWSPYTARAYQSFIQSMKVLLRRGYSGERRPPSRVKLAVIPHSIYLLAPRELVPHSLYRMLKAARTTFGKPVTELTVVNYCEQVPNRESRVFLGVERDKLNMQRLVLDWKVGSEETRTLTRLHELLDRHLRKRAIGYLASDEQSPHPFYSDASHHIGTTRMSEDPRKGVVDRNCVVHGLRNLFIAGSSVFPTCGYANPTWTIVALTLRLADRLKTMA